MSKEQKYVRVPVAWFEQLLEHVEGIKKSMKDMEGIDTTERFNFLLGYCSSAKTILNNFRDE